MILLTAGKYALGGLGGFTALKYIYTKGKAFFSTAKTTVETDLAAVKKAL